MRTISLLAAGLLTVSAAGNAQSTYADDRYDLTDPRLGREVGRAVGQATIAAHRLAAEARIAARRAASEYRRGYAEAFGTPPHRYDIGSQREAVDACAIAAEDEASRTVDFAEVNDIVDVDRFGEGWDVEGTVEVRDGYRDAARGEWRFTCAIRSGHVERVAFGAG